MWSLGVLLYAILCGTVPFKAPSMPELHKMILAGEFKYPVELSADARNMVEGLMKLEPTQRLTIPQIMAHAWLKETNEESEEEEEEPSSSSLSLLLSLSLSLSLSLHLLHCR